MDPIKSIYIPEEFLSSPQGSCSWGNRSNPILYTTKIAISKLQLEGEGTIDVIHPIITAREVKLSTKDLLITTNYDIGLKNIDLEKLYFELIYKDEKGDVSLTLGINDVIDGSSLIIPDRDDIKYIPRTVPETYINSSNWTGDASLYTKKGTNAIIAELEPVQIELDGVKLAKALLQHEKCGQYIVDTFLKESTSQIFFPAYAESPQTIISNYKKFIPLIIRENKEILDLFKQNIEKSKTYEGLHKRYLAEQ